MATLQEIKNRIESVKDTQKITNAMYLISSTKLRKARQEMEATRPYYNGIRAEIKRLFARVSGVNSRYVAPTDGELPEGKTWACLVLTSDKGLAGNFNRSVLKEAVNLQKQHEDMVFYAIGENGKAYLTNHGYRLAENFNFSPQDPTIGRARMITVRLQDDFDNGVFDRLYIIYTDIKNGLVSETIIDRVIPFSRAYFMDDDEEEEVKEENDREEATFEYIPSREAVLDKIIPLTIVGYIYSAMVTSFCSEQNARMMAMDAANTNAEEILAEYTLQYNRVRQGAITQEITEISSGAKAQQKK
ncbi:MAG: ATP synthase F1 subunit gamma [Lachnospiraceae bacterium]|nr:ATP synthase F1 subunit gamma [Lachnospiraceae bacterium]